MILHIGSLLAIEPFLIRVGSGVEAPALGLALALDLVLVRARVVQPVQAPSLSPCSVALIAEAREGVPSPDRLPGQGSAPAPAIDGRLPQAAASPPQQSSSRKRTSASTEPKFGA
ncbi:hypothetical protein SAMN04488245_109145 [Alloyangia pacifica]|nr:hypothetical protein SAMN04488245_109145 [Alloyangia pacifica]